MNLATALLVAIAATGFLLWHTFDRHTGGILPLVAALNRHWIKIPVPANFVGYGAYSPAAMIGVEFVLKSRSETINPIHARLPELSLLDDLMDKAIALSFAFFTLATILGALWAAEVWNGKPMARWAISGFFVTLFAFLGVNMFLSGLHSYGEL